MRQASCRHDPTRAHAREALLDHGHIVEQGTHEELLRHGGHYAALWKRQSGGFIDAAPEARVDAAE